MDLANAAYQQMQREYHEFRQTLFTFLRTCADLESRWGPKLHGVSDEIQQKYRMLETRSPLIVQGTSCLECMAIIENHLDVI